MKYIQPDWPAPAQVKAYTTLRDSWHGRRAPAATPLTELLSLPNEPIWLKQTHSTTVLKATPDHTEQAADASHTDTPNHVCVVMTADCLPILICHRNGTHVAAVHAGWRGLANGIVEATLDALAQPREQLLVWLGPAISAKHFEVGQDVYDAFTHTHPQVALAFKKHTPGKWFADLYAIARLKLQQQGVQAIYGGQFCTYAQPDLFYSYRRDPAETGRMASLIWLNDEVQLHKG